MGLVTPNKGCASIAILSVKRLATGVFALAMGPVVCTMLLYLYFAWPLLQGGHPLPLIAVLSAGISAGIVWAMDAWAQTNWRAILLILAFVGIAFWAYGFSLLLQMFAYMT